MAHFFFNKLKNAARYVGQYLRPYLDASRAYFIGGLAEKYGFNRQSIDHVVHFLVNGAIENVGEVQKAWKNEPDALGRRPYRALDATVSFDKVFSVAFVVCANHRDALLATATQALEKVFALLEERCAVARSGPDGRHVHGRWAALVVPEFTSRNGDIQIHFHVILFTALECADGVVRALDTRPLFDHAKWAGALLTAEHAKALADAGLAVTSRDGRLAIEGIPEALCDRWSSRRKEVVAFMETHGLSTPKESDRAALASRERKHRDEPLDETLTRHEAEARSLGFDLRKIEELCFGRGRELARPVSRDEVGRATHEVETKLASFNPRDFELLLAKEAPRLGIGIDDIVSLARQAMQRVRQTLDHLERDLAQRIVTKTLDTLRKRDGFSATERSIDHAAAKHVLPPKAHQALQVLTRQGSRARLLDGPDAAERRLVLAALRDAFERSGIDCVAVTLRRKDAKSLHDATGLPVFTAAKAVHEWTRAREPRLFENLDTTAFRKIRTIPIQDTLAWAAGLRSRSELAWRSWQRERQPLDLTDGPHVLIVEEAQNLSKARLGEILSEAKGAGATVILAGDSLRSSRFGGLLGEQKVASLQPSPAERKERELEGILRILRAEGRPLPPVDSKDLGLPR